jgi:hypothetical protein
VEPVSARLNPLGRLGAPPVPARWASVRSLSFAKISLFVPIGAGILPPLHLTEAQTADPRVSPSDMKRQGSLYEWIQGTELR